MWTRADFAGDYGPWGMEMGLISSLIVIVLSIP